LQSPASNPSKRFFVQFPALLTHFPTELLITDHTTVHYLRTVVRIRTGEGVILVDPERGTAYQATIQDVEKSGITAAIAAVLSSPTDSLPEVTLAVALIKEQRWDWLLQKSTELGVAQIQPLLAERSVVKLGPADLGKKRERWQAVLQSAAEQSEGLFIPQVLTPRTVVDFCHEKSSSPCFLLKERGEDRPTLKTALHGILLSAPKPKALCLAIGPEGGWTPAELQLFQQSGFEAVSLGDRILRSETAAIAAMAAVAYETS
jgi:16S rRNA (uracil1498-N3)-methyltransferase